MVIFFNMVVKKPISKIFAVITVALLNLLLVTEINAASPSLSFYPSSGIVKSSEEGFTVDVLIDSGDKKLAKARMVFNFDPSQLQIRTASRNNSLFEQWPNDESTLDNTNGVVMLTGFTQSGSGTLYQSSGEAELLARIEFDVLEEEEDAQILLQWEYSGSDDLFQSVLLADGSPPQNVLDTRPEDAAFRFGELTQTAIDPRHLTFVIGGILILLAGVLISSKPEFTRKKYGTVVVYD